MNVFGRVKFYTKLYKEVLKVFNRANNHAIYLKRKFKFKRISNCKILAQKVVSYKIRNVIKVLLVDLKKYAKFWKKTYNGFYCTLCDSHYHRFIDLNE